MLWRGKSARQGGRGDFRQKAAFQSPALCRVAATPARTHSRHHHRSPLGHRAEIISRPPKAPEDWRTPRRFAQFGDHWQTLRVLDCGGPPPLSPRPRQRLTWLEPGHPASDYSCPHCGFWYQLKGERSRPGCRSTRPASNIVLPKRSRRGVANHTRGACAPPFATPSTTARTPRSAVCPTPQRVASQTTGSIIRSPSRSSTRCELGQLALRPPSRKKKPPASISCNMIWRRGASAISE